MAILDLPWWGYILVALGLTHVTIAAVTVFLHRHQAHHAVGLRPIVSHFFRFWLWLTTGMETRAWVAIHRKHHAKCETPEDPHSPQVRGLRQVLLSGAELYRAEAGNPKTLDKYGRGTPDDWLERHLYARYPAAGIATMLIIDVILFGPIGLTLWAVQMIWIPLFAAGIINGIGHYWGYRNFTTGEASLNIIPWGILIGGEELHNNHHAHSASARLSSRWWEFDLGWAYLRLLEILGLAKVRHVAPRLCLNAGKTCCDIDTARAVTLHRFEILSNFARRLRKTVGGEVRNLRSRATLEFKDRKIRAAVKHSLQNEAGTVPQSERDILEWALNSSWVLKTIFTMRQELTGLWKQPPASKEQMARQLEDWCQRAEASGIGALKEFSCILRCYGCR